MGTAEPGGAVQGDKRSAEDARDYSVRTAVDLRSGAAHASFARGRRFCAEGPEAGSAAVGLIRRPASC